MGRQRMLRFLLASLIIGGVCLQSPELWSQVCKPTTHKNLQVVLQNLRRTSIELRGQVPTIEEAQKVIRAGHIPKELIDGWLKQKEAMAQLRAYHRDLLWANMSALDFNNDWKINRGDGEKTPFWSTYISEARGGEVGCLDKEAERNSDGSFKMETDPKDPKIKREGWVKIRPYWSDKEVKVCGIDALGVSGKGGQCGENLRHCQSDHAKTQQIITQALVEQTLKFAENIIQNNRPYTDFIRAKETVFNGPIAHFLHYQLHTINRTQIKNIYKDVPKIDFRDRTWKKVKVGEKHSGMLTMPLYLLKYTSNRSRASQFYTKMLCKPFQAPPGGLPPGNDPCHNEPNLMKRCGCRYCHQTLEPAASYWGRWLQTGLVYLDAKQYPAFQQECSGTRANRSKCRQYVIRANHPDQEQYRGYLAAYMFSTSQMKENIEKGPIGLAQTAIDSKIFARCTTQNVWKWFVGNPAPSSELLEELAHSFQKNGYNFQKLLKAIITHPVYTRGRLYHINQDSK